MPWFSNHFRGAHFLFNKLKTRECFWTHPMSWKHLDALTTDIKREASCRSTLFLNHQMHQIIFNTINNVSLPIWIYLSMLNWSNILINQYNSSSHQKGNTELRRGRKDMINKNVSSKNFLNLTPWISQRTKKKIIHWTGFLIMKDYYSMV